MRQLYIILSLVFLVQSCDDGDVQDISFDFDKELTLCNQNSTDFLVYDTRATPYESLSLIFPRAGNEAIFAPTQAADSTEMTINGTSIKFNYRTYDGNPSGLICALIPDANTQILSDYSAASGAKVKIVTTYTDVVGTSNTVRKVRVKFVLRNINLEIFSATQLDFGVYEYEYIL